MQCSVAVCEHRTNTAVPTTNHNSATAAITTTATVTPTITADTPTITADTSTITADTSTAAAANIVGFATPTPQVLLACPCQ